MDPSTRERWTPEQKVEFVTNLVQNETFVTELVQQLVMNVEENTFVTEVYDNDTFITNLQTVVNNFITQIKGSANQIPSLNSNGKVPKGQIDSDYIDNPMTAAGDLIYGGAGTPSGFVDVLAGLSGSGGGGVSLSTSAGAGGWQAGWTNGTPTAGNGGPTWNNNAWLKADLGAATLIGRFRYTGDAWGNNGPDQDLILESSDNNSDWTVRWQMTVDGPTWSTVLDTGSGWVFGDYRDTGLIVLPQPVRARYWRIRGTGSGSGNPWTIGLIQLDAVQVVADTEGNPTALAAPVTSPRLLGYDAGAPMWRAPAAANADTSGATLGQLETEVNELKAVLRSFGIIAPS